MKKIVSIALVLMMVLSLLAGCNSGNTATTPAAGADLAGTYKITMWVSETDGVADQFKEQIKKFNETNEYGIIIEAQIEGVSEANAGSQVLADVASAPDVFCFAQDQLARLVQAQALAELGQGAAATVTANNDAGSVAAATVAGKLYAYPMTSDNGYYMYYDKSMFTDADIQDLAALVAKCEQNNVKFRFGLENGWYVASFFFATGCVTNWTTNENGEFVSVHDTFNSAEGMIAMKAMQILTKSPCYDSNADIFTDAGVIVTGIWNANSAADHFGDNLGAAKLPSFTMDGKTYQLGSYSGNKLMGVKPQSDAKRGAALSLLAQYLTNEECQNQRYASFQWGPSNKNAQATEAVQSNISLAALAAQNAFGTPQGQIAGVYWDNASALAAVAKNATSDADLQAGLDNYKTAIDAYLSLTPEQRRAFTVIGDVKNSGWGTDFEMKEDPAGTWTSVEAFELAAGTQFKVRQGMDWKIAYGDNAANADTSIPLSNKPNYVVETAGTYYIQIVVAEDGTAVINLIPA